MQSCNSPRGIIFDEDLVILDLRATDREDVLMKIGGILIDRGYVNGDFINAIIKRERDFPTGIKTQSIGVAIPHTDTEYVNQASIIVGVLSKPVVFQQMVSDEDIAINIVFMLAIKEPEQQLTMLQRLVDIIQDDTTLNSICEATSELEIATIMRGKLGDEIRREYR
ncbi:PTS sugar transporter subunit IIA [Bacillus sp. FJAT-50079]|uniref:PTS sugar transporter subunit IIA n=1 Tax=Bacillus sp. FJAT-50079 TaxID=2833577 RepID=UPI001BC93223|nr:PTS sugar transporter subunit IIA [Bacillus sp. FJAT-50079]MBS4207879.1 PTS sugar transporter subunit IIA [Bacillus sp. FJAT-50079]